MSMSPRRLMAVLGSAAALGLAGLVLLPARRSAPPPALTAPSESAAPLAGSASCRACHAVFFQKWSTSFHGLAMQAHTGDFARDRLTPQERPLEIRGRSYRAVIGTGADHVEETWPQGRKTHPIAQVLGGKNVCYFLTPLDRGLLQVLPLAYDVNRKEWFSTAGSAVRHFAASPTDEGRPSEGLTDEELDWTDRAYTFNTSCFSCHVSQLATNYEPATDSYRTVWAEPGVSCETCHGPAGEHVNAFQGLPPGQAPPDGKIVSVRKLTTEQRNDLCASCHAKASPLWTSFRPGDRFFDHFDLTTLESPDYHPDGRDLGENYTFTSWRQSPCARSGRIDCVHCHTSSGRYKFKDRPNDACLPCHEERVKNAAAHTRHPGDGPGTRCTDCHMPKTEFARMIRSDHSMRPPSPAATRELGSPNACTLCHRERGVAWAAKAVRDWGGGRWSERILREGRLVAAARKGDGSRLPDVLAYLAEPGRDEVVTTSLVRLLAGRSEPSRGPALRALAADASPLVRAAALTVLAADPASRDLVLAATRDDLRLVRVRAAAALSAVDPATVPEPARAALLAARAEHERSLLARPDDFASQYNLGNVHLERGDPAAAAERYRKALALRPDHVASLVNLSMAEARLGRLAEAEVALREAIRVQPREAAAHFNLGLLLAEAGRPRDAQASLRRALELDPRNAGAAYNLAVLVAEASPKEAASLAGRAADGAPEDPRYAFTQAFYLEKAGDAAGAERVLRSLVARHPGYRDAPALLGALLEGQGRSREAADVYRRAAASATLPAPDRRAFEARARAAVRNGQ
jgi:tetratricopeptide (TPR) repeat protein/nitrate/TMAO reductase-like tetraheme cytochrome c subunit